MMIDIPRLRASSFDATPDDSAWRAALNLWMSSWHGDPAASLANDDGELCKAAGLGRDLRTWRKVRAVALRKWVLCDDGRLYHETVAEYALEAWLEKLAQRLSSGAGNAKRWGTAFDPAPVKADISAAAALLARLNPKSNAIQKASRHLAKPNPDGTPSPSQRDAESVPSGSQGKGREGKGLEEEHPQPPPGAFEDAFRAYPEIGRANTDEPLAREAWAAVVAEVGAEPLLAAIKAYAASDAARRAPRFDRWLKRGLWSQWIAVLAVPGTWTGPPDLRAAVEAAEGPAWAASWLLPCAWRDLPTPTLVAPREIVAHRLLKVTKLLAGAGITVVVERAA